MFREMRRFKQAVSKEECIKVLTEESRGVLSVAGDDGYPYGIPLDFYYDEAENRIYFHCAKAGHKLDAIKANDKVCFTTWNTGFKKDGDWAWNVTSVVAFGRAHLVEDLDVAKEKIRKLGCKYFPTEDEVDEEIRKDFDRAQMVMIDIEHMTGKLVNEK